MSREFYLNAHAMADRHVAEGVRIIFNQRRIIAQLDERGADTVFANDLLLSFLECQRLHEADRRRFAIETGRLKEEAP